MVAMSSEIDMWIFNFVHIIQGGEKSELLVASTEHVKSLRCPFQAIWQPCILGDHRKSEIPKCMVGRLLVNMIIAYETGSTSVWNPNIYLERSKESITTPMYFFRSPKMVKNGERI